MLDLQSSLNIATCMTMQRLKIWAWKRRKNWCMKLRMSQQGRIWQISRPPMCTMEDLWWSHYACWCGQRTARSRWGKRSQRPSQHSWTATRTVIDLAFQAHTSSARQPLVPGSSETSSSPSSSWGHISPTNTWSLSSVYLKHMIQVHH